MSLGLILSCRTGVGEEWGPERVSVLKEDSKVGANQVLRRLVLQQRTVSKKDSLVLLSRGPTSPPRSAELLLLRCQVV